MIEEELIQKTWHPRFWDEDKKKIIYNIFI